MTNMERFEAARNYWSEIFEPQTKAERHLATLIAFQDLLMQRSMTEALSAPETSKAMSGERRQNALIVSIERLVHVLTTVQHRRMGITAPPTQPAKVIEMPKRTPKAKAITRAVEASDPALTELEPDQMPDIFPLQPSRADGPRPWVPRYKLNIRNKPAA